MAIEYIVKKISTPCLARTGCRNHKRKKCQYPVANPLHPIQHQEALNDYVFQLLEKGSHCDELELILVLQQAYHSFGLVFQHPLSFRY